MEAKNLGEGTADYYKQQQSMLAGSFNAGIGNRMQNNFAIQPRLGGTFKQAGHDMMFNNK